MQSRFLMTVGTAMVCAMYKCGRLFSGISGVKSKLFNLKEGVRSLFASISHPSLPSEKKENLSQLTVSFNFSYFSFILYHFFITTVELFFKGERSK